MIDETKRKPIPTSRPPVRPVVGPARPAPIVPGRGGEDAAASRLPRGLDVLTLGASYGGWLAEPAAPPAAGPEALPGAEPAFAALPAEHPIGVAAVRGARKAWKWLKGLFG